MAKTMKMAGDWTYHARPFAVKAIQWTGENAEEIDREFGTDVWIHDGVVSLTGMEEHSYANIGDYVVWCIDDAYVFSKEVFEMLFIKDGSAEDRSCG